MFLRTLFVTAILCCAAIKTPAQKSKPATIDSAIAVAVTQQHLQQPYIKTCFFIADEYMNIEQYDSAQIWLNRIHVLLPAKKVSLENYFLLTRQAEVYYYNNLQQLGLQESRRGLLMAEVLNDSVLLADSYNFLGLFYMNIDSAALSVTYYTKGLQYTKQPPNPPQYISLSKPHHLHGNLAEAYYKLGKMDSALQYYRYSFNKATEIQWDRGIAVACSGLGDVFFAQHLNDSAFFYYDMGVKTATRSADVDVALICYGGKASCFTAMGNTAAAFEELDKGLKLLKQLPNINRFYSLSFLNTAASIYKRENNAAALINVLEVKSEVERANIAGNNNQIQTILNAGMENEKRLLSLQVNEAERKQELANSRLLIALGGIALLVIGFLVYRYNQNQKLAVSKMRHKISQDLHDDIGASLSSLQIYGTIAEQSLASNPAKAKEMLGKINVQSKEILDNMGDIVWSMNSTGAAGTSLETKIKNYAADLLQDKSIQFTYNIAPAVETALQNMQARKNLLLVTKEAINNIAKHSNATAASLHLEVQDKKIVLQISDNGTGYDSTAINTGNGLGNIKARINELYGEVVVTSAKNSGTAIAITIPAAAAGNARW